VLVAGAVLAWLTGCALLLVLPAPSLLRLILGLLFTVASWLELRGQRRGMARIDRIRISPEGCVEGSGPAGQGLPLELLAGSLVLTRFAWFRLRFADGTVHGEWLLPGRGEREQWRMLQLIWRQSAGRLGRPLRS
jgi:hypothetical protein